MIDKLELISRLPGLTNIKDVNSKFISFSQDFAKLLGWKSSDDSLGKMDYDIPCSVSEFADEFIKMDKKVFATGVKLLALDIQKYVNGWKLILAEKHPIKDDNGKMIGSFSSCIDVTDVSMFMSYFTLHQFDNKIVGKGIKAASYILSDFHRPLPLTEKQQNCLFFLIRGKSLKEIAKLLKVSPRTIECHIEAIKNKLKCQYKSEIIEKSIDSGFLFYVPKLFQECGLGKMLNMGA